MKQNFKLTKDQQTLVEKNLSIVHWVIVNNIHVNPGICGLEYGDLFQEGCLWLCKAAFTYHAGQAQFSTYAKKVVKNGLLSYCRKICSQGRHISRLIIGEQGELAADGESPLVPDQPNNMILTSGSSGTPKAVVHRLANHLASARGSATLIPLDEACGWLLSLPLFHVGGYAILFRVFLAGAALMLDDRTRPLKARLEDQPITHLSLVPTQLWRLLAQGFDPGRTRLRELLLGGAAIPEPLVNHLKALGFTPKSSYGLSEMGSQVCTGQPAGAGVVGRPLPGREVSIRQGEICVRGDTLFAGYFQAGELVLPLDEEGWFHTRDKGHFTPGGELVVEGRLDNLFISGGENIQPETIEQRLVDHPAVAQALVVPVPSDEWGQRPAAFIDWLAEPVPHDELVTWIRHSLPGFMVPDRWLPWPDLAGSLKPSRTLLAHTLRQEE